MNSKVFSGVLVLCGGVAAVSCSAEGGGGSSGGDRSTDAGSFAGSGTGSGTVGGGFNLAGSFTAGGRANGAGAPSAGGATARGGGANPGGTPGGGASNGGTQSSSSGGSGDGGVTGAGGSVTSAGGSVTSAGGSVTSVGGSVTSAGGSSSVGTIVTPGDPGGADVSFRVHAAESVHPISPLIYGTNGAPEIGKTHQTVVRSGGNRMTAYDWENNASNAGSDYLFQNDGYLDSSNAPGKVALDVMDTANQNGATAIVTIPIVDYVAADKNGGGDVRNSGSNYLTTRFRKNEPVKGSAFAASPDTADGSVYEDEFVAFLKAQRPNGRVVFSMDNEPDLWSATHAEVYPSKATYADLWDRNRRFATAVKNVWPAAEILGFVSYGFNGYVNLQSAPDGAGRNFVEWYLDQAKAAENAGGKRLVDYLDLHWYSEARGGGARITEGDSSNALVTAREQAPRSLWDPSYRETSWIADYMGGPIDLLHWLRTKVDAHYPGTKLSFTEWNYGGGDHVSGAIASADVLGIFGRESVGLATYWPLKSNETFTWAAFRVYRNYDGSGGAFGDTSISATTSDAATASVYASISSSDADRTVLVAINKSTSARTAGLRVFHSATYAKAAVYLLTGGAADVAPAGSITPVATNAFRYDMPAQSVSVLVLEK